MAYGPNMLRNGAVQINPMPSGVTGGAISLAGTAWPVGSVVELAWGPTNAQPTTAWVATPFTTPGTGNWSVAATRLAGTNFLFARLRGRPRVFSVSAAVVGT